MQITLQVLIEKETSEEVHVRVTGIKNNSMIVKIGTKRRVLECSEEIIKEVENFVPCKRSVKITNNKVISCTENNYESSYLYNDYYVFYVFYHCYITMYSLLFY